MRRHLNLRKARGVAASTLVLAAAAFGINHLAGGDAPFAPALAAESIDAPLTQTIISSAATTQEMTVRKGDTLYSILEYAGASKRNAAAAARAVKKVFDPKKLRVGQRIFIRLETSGGGDPMLAVFSVELGANSFVQVARIADGKFRANHATQPWPSDAILAAAPAANGAISVEARRGDTIGNIMRAHGIWERDIDRAVKALRARFDPRDLMVGQQVSLLPGETRGDGTRTLIGVAVHLDGGAVVEAVRKSDGVYGARRADRLSFATPETVQLAATQTVVQKPASNKPVAPAPVTAKPAQHAAPENNLAGTQQKVRVAKGATLMDVLTDTGISRAEADRAIRALRPYFDPRRLRAGQSVQIVLGNDDRGKPVLQGFSVPLGSKRHAAVTRDAAGEFAGGLTKAPLQGLDDIAPAAKTPALADIPTEPTTSESLATALAETPEAAAPAIDTPSTELAATEVAATDDTNAGVSAMTIEVARGDTLMAILRSEGIDRTEADQAIRALSQKFNPRRLREGQKIILATRSDKTGALSLEGFSIALAKDRHVEVVKQNAKKFSVAIAGESHFMTALAASGASPDEGGGKPARSSTRLAPRPGQGGAMSGAIIAAAAPAEQALGADPARVWPQNAITDAKSRDGANGFNISAATTKMSSTDGLTRKAVMIGKGDTLFVALTKAGSAAADAEAAIAAFRTVHNPRSLQIGQTLTVAFEPLVDADKEAAFRLAEIALDVAPDRDVLVARQADNSFRASEVARDLERRLERGDGVIQSSLYEAAMEAGLPISILMELVQIFSFDVDFQREIQKGDRFEVLYENQLNEDGESVALGPVLFASLVLSGQEIALYRHEPADGPVDYFDAKGQSARKALMLTPINGARLSSGFGMRRHPVLGYNKMHRGLDFAAPKGTPVFAAGDGVIEQIGRNGSYGNYIRIRHNGTYKTAYAHLNGFARGMKAGKRVRQGQTIAYVGTTGRSTGPHLHYEVLRGGKQMNPRKLKLPTGQKLKGEAFAQFQQQVRKVEILLAEVPKIHKIASR